VGKTHGYQTQSTFEINQLLHAGKNLIAVGVKNDGGPGGINPRVNLVVCKPPAAPWSRSLFNGLAQVIVQSTREVGEFRLSASADGLTPATAVVRTQPCALLHHIE
jgi:beta-galactosidase